MNRNIFLTSAMALAFVSSVQAQTLPNSGDALRQVQSQDLASEQRVNLPDFSGENIPSPMQALPGGPTLEVKAIRITGNNALSQKELSGVIKYAVGKTLTLQELEEVALRVTKYYRVKGYFVARAYIPAQEVVDGEITIQVVEGNYGRFVLKNGSLARDEVVQGILDSVKDYDVVSVNTLERAMLIANETPGVQVTRADVMPGEKVGTSDFAVDTIATARQTGYVAIDNYGSRYTGVGRLSFAADLNEPTGSGDRLSISGMLTEDSNLINGRLAYEILIKPNGLRGELAFAQTNYSLGDTYEDLDAFGTAKSFDGSITYPIEKNRNSMIDANLTVSAKKLKDVVLGEATPKQILSTSVGLSLHKEGKLFGSFGTTKSNISFTLGELDIQSDEALSIDNAGAQTQGGFVKLSAYLARSMILSNEFKLTGQVRFQQSLTNKNLDSSERMGVSGSGAVMAYPSGELSGTNAVYARIELAKVLPAVLSAPDFSQQVSVFSDWGMAGQAQAVDSNDKQRHISDVGLGYSVNYKKLSAKLVWAHRLESSAARSEPVGRERVLAQLAWSF